MNIKKLKSEERPREKLIKKGSLHLSDYELLAIMLGSGTKEKSVLDLSIEIINNYGFSKLFSMSFNELKSIKGIKEAKATKLMACFEIAKRCQIEMNTKESIKLEDSNELYTYLKNHFLCEHNEKLFVIYSDVKCRVIKYDELSNDNVAEVYIPIKKIIKDAILYNAYGIFIAHNHPSGDVSPSKADISATARLNTALKSIGVYLLDHMIIGNNNFYSFSDNKLISY